jgi:hypothetical protein
MRTRMGEGDVVFIGGCTNDPPAERLVPMH